MAERGDVAVPACEPQNRMRGQMHRTARDVGDPKLRMTAIGRRLS